MFLSIVINFIFIKIIFILLKNWKLKFYYYKILKYFLILSYNNNNFIKKLSYKNKIKYEFFKWKKLLFY